MLRIPQEHEPHQSACAREEAEREATHHLRSSTPVSSETGQTVPSRAQCAEAEL